MKSNYSWLDADYLVLLPVAILLGSCAPDIETTPVTTLDDPHWLVQPSGTTQRFQAISIVDRSTVWVSGTGGTYSYTTNGGLIGIRQWLPMPLHYSSEMCTQ